MRVELYIMRCKIDYLEALREALEKFCQNYNIHVVEKSEIVCYVSVYEEYLSTNKKHCILIFENEHKVMPELQTKKFDFYI